MSVIDCDVENETNICLETDATVNFKYALLYR